MDPTGIIGGALGGIGSIVGGIIGNSQAQAQRDQARQILQSIIDRYGSIPQPILDQMQAEQLGPSAMGETYADPALEATQRDMLGRVTDIAHQGGMTVGDRAGMIEAQNEASRRNGAERQALEQMLQNRGLGGSGSAVALRIGGQRDAQERQTNVALQSSQEAQRRALQALQMGGQMAGQMRGQGFNEASDRAKARDMFAQYNANARTNAQRYNLNLPQQRFENQMDVARGVANASVGAANNANQNAARTQRQWADTGTGIGQMAGSAVSAFGGQPPRPDPYADPSYNPYYHDFPRRVE